MQAQEPKTKMIKMRAKTAIRLGTEIIPAGKEFECTEQEAAEFSQPLVQHHNFTGQRHGSDADARHVVVRAELVK